MITRWLLIRVKRRHGALWVDLRCAEPFGIQRFAVWVHGHQGPSGYVARNCWTPLGAAWQAWRDKQGPGAP